MVNNQNACSQRINKKIGMKRMHQQFKSKKQLMGGTNLAVGSGKLLVREWAKRIKAVSSYSNVLSQV